MQSVTNLSGKRRALKKSKLKIVPREGDSKPFRCTFCKSGYKYASSLQLHMKESHDVRVTPKTDSAANMTNDKACVLSSRGGQEKKDQVCTLMKCPNCEQEFSWKRTMMEHRKRVHFYGAFKCIECNLDFQFAKDLSDHMQEDAHEESFVYCPSCVEQIHMEDIEEHYKVCVFQERKLELKGGKLRKTRKRMPIPKARKCPYCQKLIKSVDSLNQHKKRKHKWGLFRCPKCDESAPFAMELMKHMLENNHGEEPNVKCPSCKDLFDILDLSKHYEGRFISTLVCLSRFGPIGLGHVILILLIF